jgi:selenocysteine-specific elongation factor
VAADDGVMPQTVEHAEVLRGLGVADGVVAITKADAGGPGRGRRAGGGAAARPRDGRLLGADGRRARRAARRAGPLAARLPGGSRRARERGCTWTASFTVPGRGTVVTGTLWSGELAAATCVELLPGPRRPSGCEGLQVHDVDVRRARPASASR